jgi:hypothetical protein
VVRVPIASKITVIKAGSFTNIEILDPDPDPSDRVKQDMKALKIVPTALNIS